MPPFGYLVSIVAIYFVMAIGIGLYLVRFEREGHFARSSRRTRRRSNGVPVHSLYDEGYTIGRDMTAWIAGLSFLAPNLGRSEVRN